MLLALGLANTCSQAVEIEGYPIAPSIQLAERALVLNGAAVRRFAIFKIEVAALYLERRLSTMEGIASDPGAKRLRLVMLRQVTAEDVHKKFMGDLRSVSTPSELAQVKREVGLLEESFRTMALKPGDVINIDWLPGIGMLTSLNGHAVGDAKIDAELLYRMVLRIFLGPDAARGPRERLLGLQPISD
jgi:HAMP domain-containing protein